MFIKKEAELIRMCFKASQTSVPHPPHEQNTQLATETKCRAENSPLKEGWLEEPGCFNAGIVKNLMLSHFDGLSVTASINYPVNPINPTNPCLDSKIPAPQE